MGTACEGSTEGGEASHPPFDAVLSQAPAPLWVPAGSLVPTSVSALPLGFWVAGDIGRWHTNSTPPTWEGRALLQP